MKPNYDLVIVGSGFGGSLLAQMARRLGKSVLLVERDSHPRFAIGESTSPFTNLLLEKIATDYDLPRLLPLTNYGSWQRTYPQLGCGLKRGFTYFHHQAGQKYRADANRANQLMVAASPNDELADTHWLRADVDQFLVNEAVALGADSLDETALSHIAFDDMGAQLSGERRGEPVNVRAGFVVDATGPRGFLSQKLDLPEVGFADYPHTQTLFSHFTGVRRCDTMDAFRSGETGETPPYPIDDAALHHVFDGGWMWVLRFGNGITSAGVAVEKWLADELCLSDGEPAWRRFLDRFPSIKDQFINAEAVRPFIFSPRLSYRCARAAGPNWALLPSAAAFVDPFFSTGFPLTLIGILRLGELLKTSDADAFRAGLDTYNRTTLEDADWTAYLISACYKAFPDFSQFAALSMFYFASASFSEIAHRIDRADLAPRFLAQAHPTFASGLRECAEWLHSGETNTEAFAQKVAEAVAPLSIAGLCDPNKRNWYGVDLDDVVRGAHKLGKIPDEMRAIIASAPWAGSGQGV